VRLLTYNLWHGLDGRGVAFFGELEPRGRRLARAQVQEKCVRQWNPDIAFFQEVNPLLPAALFFAEQLERDHIEQLDLSGIKLFGLGPPFNLQSGLAILARRGWGLRKREGLMLSGEGLPSRGFCSWQLREARYALLGELQHPQWGRVLLVSLHLHHGLEFDPTWAKILNRAVHESELTEADRRSLQRQLMQGDIRREREVTRLLDRLNELSPDFDLTVVAGDFNSSPNTPVMGLMRGAGFVDVWESSQAKVPGMTWSREANQENHAFNDGFQGVFQWQEPLGPAALRERFLELIRQAERVPRRIDYLFYRANQPVRARAEIMVGQDSETQMVGSDHFGVGVILEKVPSES
jgi:endonuclease/exonuclease/phosphatase family metal-dependent hydrolase